MKKNLSRPIKKWLALAITAVMIFAMAATAFAEEGDGGSSTATTQTATTNTTTTGNYTLTVSQNKSYDSVVTYNVYQLFTANIDDDNNALYTATTTLASLFGNDVTVDTIAAMTDNSDDLYGLVKTITSTNGITAYGTLTTGKALSITQAGYYLLIPTNTATATGTAGGAVSSAIFVAVPGVTAAKDDDGNPTGAYDLVTDVEVTSKSSEVTTDKAITDVESTYGTDDTFTSSGNTATSGSGDTIQYTITNTVPSYNADVDTSKVNYYVVDTYDTNLTIVDSSVTVTAPSDLTAGSSYDTSEVTAQDGSTYTLYTVTGGDYYVDYNAGTNQFAVYFNYSAVKNASDGVKITAQFTLNKTATPGTAVENTSKLTYTNNYYTGTDSTLQDTVESWTFGLEVYKYDTEDNSALENATFGLYSDSSCSDSTKIAEGTSGNDGIVKFDVLLNDGTYYVKEISAPDGYRVDETVYTVVITAKKDETSEEYTGAATFTVGGNAITSTLNLAATSVSANDGKTVNTDNAAIAVMGIGNTAGTTLPGTGGIGTTIFTFGGLVLVILAAILFIVYTKKQRKQA